MDGIVGSKTLSKLTSKIQELSANKYISDQELRDLASEMGVDYATVKAIQMVETGGRKGFLRDGRPRILFEGHVFWRELKKRNINPEEHRPGNEDILYTRWVKTHYKGGANEYKRLDKAIKIHEDAALCSASWGLFQIMGNNYPYCGFDSVKDFVKAMYKNEGEHLRAFFKYISHEQINCIQYLKPASIWEKFARAYNGPGFRRNNYHNKLKDAYEKYA